MNILRSPTSLIALALGIGGVVLVLYAWRLPPFVSSVQVTEDAYVRGQVTTISPQLSGYLTEVPVQDYQKVEAGQLLARIDDRIFAQKVKQAEAGLAGRHAALANSEQRRHSAEARIKSGEAQVQSAQAALDQAQAEWRRIRPLLERGFTTAQEGEQRQLAEAQARATLDQAKAALDVLHEDVTSILVDRQSLQAAVQGAEAALQLAQIDLQNTRIVAPEAGRLGEVGARLGQYVAVGTQLMALVPDRTWVVANFKETQLYGMKVGQPASFTVDALRGAAMTGHIERFSPATGSEFTVIRPDNATGNFTKVAQRLPVRIAVDQGQPLSDQLAPGMSVVVRVDTAAAVD
ncbi:MAG TPA: HlyD family secretion protein [Geminicoccus sp.]|jgi:multidrug resistance efflux pump|uniref:HlyD family secretion protein n=1 Tax=Geminicoccus sp. TaxID=2024832 RepID=UPI002E3720A6|nr:HlyD family secretion protein [Geminicoccus sp.]HEX2527878.1 HlyD family secretion protein [Geminicoccus sp.]